MAKFIAGIQAEVGKPKREFVSAAPNETMLSTIREKYTSKAREVLNISDKMDRQKATKAMMKDVAKEMEANPSTYGLEEGSSFGKESYKGVDELMYEMLRADILDEGKELVIVDSDKVRQIETETNILEGPHGSSLFTRGET